MEIPKYWELFPHVLELLKDGGVKSQREIYEELIIKLGIPESDLLKVTDKRGKPLFRVRTSWAISYLHMAGLLERISKGTYRISEMGKEFLGKDTAHLKDFVIKAVEKRRKDRKAYSQISDIVTDPLKTTKKELTFRYSEISTDPLREFFLKQEEALAGQLLERLKSLDFYKFETAVLKLLEKMGYGKAVETTRTKDEGLDGIIEGDRLGFEKIGLQAKRYTDSPVSVKSINEFIGSLNRKGLKKGVFITTSRFTSEALKASEEASIGGIKLSLIDGMKLAKLMIEYNVGVYVKERYEIKAIDENFFDNL